MAERLEKQAASIQQSVLGLDLFIQNLLNDISEENIELSSLRYLWNEKRIGLVLYQDNVASNWTTSIIPFAERFDDRHRPEEGIVRLKHAWYLCRAVQQDSQLLVAYALLHSDYDFENRYVKNGWSSQIPNAAPFVLTRSELQDYPISIDGLKSEIGIRAVEHKDVNGALDRDAIIWLSFIVLLLITVWFAANWVSTITSNTIADLSFVLLLVILRVLMVWWESPFALYQTELFGPTQHATSTAIPSLGDLILHLICLYLIALRLSGRAWRIENTHVQRFLAIALPVILIWPLCLLLDILVANSSFSLDLNSPFSLNSYSLLGLTTAFLGITIYYLVYRKLYDLLRSDQRKASVMLPWLGLGALLLALMLDFDAYGLITALISAVLIGFLMLSQHWLKSRSGLYYHAPHVLVFSIISCVILIHATTKNELDTRTTIARKLDQKQNPITEFLFDDLAQEIVSDRQLRVSLSTEFAESNNALQNIHQKLAYDHWNRYENIIDMFNYSSGGLMMSDRKISGPNYFELQRMYENAMPTISDQLRYVSGLGAQGGYLARLEIQYPRKKDKLITFITLIPEKSDDILGFTDLFVDEEYSTSRQLEGYSYAIYQNGELLDRNGSYPYSLTDQRYKNQSEAVYSVDQNGYSHLMARTVAERLVVVSRPRNGALAFLTTFSYLFLFYLACSILLALLSGRLIQNLKRRNSFRNRINLAMSAVSFISLALIGALTVVYVMHEYDDRNKEMISEKSRSVLLELENKLKGRGDLENDQEMITALLTKFSKVFFTDINLYRFDGHLLATSRPRLFDEGLMAEVMDPEAYDQMRFEQSSSFINEEKIGELEYLSAYVPFRDDNGEVIAFMSLPYFARQYGLQQEIFSLLATLTNIYVFLILISVLLALFISNRITEPLRIIRESLRNLKLDETNRTIDWKSNDEIGQLVDEYNRTLSELVHSAELLARSERESAWREMAKQVAHEIKNPLTPMKLSIQMLQRSKADGVEDLNERIDRTSRTLIEQIDTLSNIATEFSSFAKMPKSNIEEIDLISVIESSIDLHKNSEVQINLETDAEEKLVVQADRDQLIRVFNNLIKNGIQATPDGQTPEITIGLTKNGGQCIIALKDNGSGIPEELKEKIFVPNFTTKSSGMGLGLAMVKNIVETSNGKIWFESEEGKGTVFYISFLAS